MQILDAIDSLVDRYEGTLLAISGAARGGDILFLEACVARGITSMICLPSAPARFKPASVEGAVGDWVNRFDRLWGTARAGLRLVMPKETHPDDADENQFARHNRWMIHVARRLGTNIHLIALWDGKEGDGCGGTASMVRDARQMGLEITHIDARSLTSA